ncbi:hypothetical protein C2R22_14555 [Salinigranum rubrum]|uniref:Uncharacterized protein n=1 Tax=Salinigranum rubrum TaxID=755307 RepID=A0A2I8VLE4_9EURY|nr:hypothetical protein [Salinigranum rubrum]AUV82715.1 hypothetical protein C2R22_14555 [Salinigranum rubrum]
MSDDENGATDAVADESDSVPLVGTTLVLGPSNVGKTTLTAQALERWVDAHGTEGVVVFDFAPELLREGTLLGGRLDRVTDLLGDADSPVEAVGGNDRDDRTTVGRPNGLWYGVLDAHAPRAAGPTEDAAVALAAENAAGAARLLERAPTDPRAVFVNDVTIACQHPAGDADRLLAYCGRARAAVLNAFESDELGVDDPVSRQERVALATLVAGADRVVRLS